MGHLARWAVRKPVLALITFFVAFLVIGILGGRFGGDLKDSFDLPGTESQVAQNLLAETAGADAATGATANLVWGVTDGTVTDATVKQTVIPLMEEIAALPDVACVTSPYGEKYGTGCPEQRQQDNAFPLPPEIQEKIDKATAAAIKATSPISENEKVARATVAFASATDIPTETATAILDEVEATNGTNGVTIGASGQVLAFAGQEPPSGELIGILVAIVILLLAFGSLVAAGLPIVTAVFGLGAGLSLVTFTANFFNVATFAPTLAAMIGLGVGIDYALFILNRYRQAVLAGHSPKDAAYESVNTAGRAVQFAGTTVIIALLGLFVLGIGFFNGLALAASLTVAMVMLSAVWFLPALLSLLGTKALAIRMPWNRKDKEWHPEGGRWAHYGHILQKRPWLYTIAAAALVMVMAIPYFSIRLGFPDDSGQPEGSTARIAYDLTAEGFGPGSNGPFFVAVQLPYALDEDSLRSLIVDLNATPGVARTIPNEAMVPISVTANQTIAAIQVIPTTSPQDPATEELLQRLREETIPQAEQGTTMRAYVGGATAGDHGLHVGPVERPAGVPGGCRRPGLHRPDDSVPVPAGATDRSGDVVAEPRSGAWRDYRGVPMGLGREPAGSDLDRSDPALPADHGLRDPLRAFHGLPGLPGQPDARGVGQDQGQRAVSAPRPGRLRACGRDRGGHHVQRVPGLHPDPRGHDQTVRCGPGHGRACGCLHHPSGARALAHQLDRTAHLVAAEVAGLPARGAHGG